MYQAAAVYRNVYKNNNYNYSNLKCCRNSIKLTRLIKTDIIQDSSSVVRTQKENGVLKFITRLKDGAEIESVIIPMATRFTLCISSQVGCRMNCRFCETAQMGFVRNLEVEEIVGQLFTAKFGFGVEIRNVVFMGMGEPFDNFQNVIQSIKILNEQRGFDIAMRHITISTVGLPDGIQHLATLDLPLLKLAISLNAPNDQIRSNLMPINLKFNMKSLKKVLTEYPTSKSDSFFITYVLIKNINDSHENAYELARFLRPLKTKINIIPYNPQNASPFRSPSENDIQRFCSWLMDQNVFVCRRSAKGQNITAACGQLCRRSSLMKNSHIRICKERT